MFLKIAANLGKPVSCIFLNNGRTLENSDTTPLVNLHMRKITHLKLKNKMICVLFPQKSFYSIKPIEVWNLRKFLFRVKIFEPKINFLAAKVSSSSSSRCSRRKLIFEMDRTTSTIDVGVVVVGVGVGQVFGVVTSEFLTDFYVRRPDLLELDWKLN